LKEKGKFEIESSNCQASEFCVDKCSVHALEAKNEEIIVNHDLCISCREFGSLCPGNAIKIVIK
jgi:energy-converting hydrogenase A subunit Q